MKKEYTCDCNIIHQQVVKDTKEKMLKEKTLKNMSIFFSVLKDQTRIKIIWSLDKQEMCVCDIANVLNMTKSSVSHQLAILRKAQIVKDRKSGEEVYYNLDDEHINKLYEIAMEHIIHQNKGENHD